MKKVFTIIVALFVLTCAVFSFSACNKKDETKLPSTSYEKVQFALNGVERSLNGSDTKKAALNASVSGDTKLVAFAESAPVLKLMAKNVSGDSLSTIYSAMSVEENTDKPSFEYDEPPMIQFQYLKALYEEIGDEFVFGTKYSNTSTGTICYDFENRMSSTDEKFLNEYSFTCAIVLDIDENDLITASVGFDLTFTNNGISRHEKMYVELVLDYDMNEISPTYELSMNAVTDLLDYQNSNEKYFNDEYDYVKVEKNSIKEWRKFGICSPASLTEYQNEDFVYKYSVLRAFKDSKKYRIENVFNKNTSLKSAVVDCLDLSATLSDYTAFFNAAGTDNTKIKTVIDKFSAIYGKDIVNSLVYTGATEKWVDDREPESENLFLRVEFTGGEQIYQDVNLEDLFNPNVGFETKGVKGYLTVYYKNGEDNTIATYNDFDNLNVKVRSTLYGKAEWIDVDNNDVGVFSDYVKGSGFKGYYDENNLDYSPMSLEFDISLKSNPNVKLQSSLIIDLFNNDCYKNLSKEWT